MIALHSHRRGFTLLEILCVLALLTLVLMMGTLLFRETLRVEQIQAAGFERILQSKALADQFRTDVAQAESEVKDWNQFSADETTLILQMKNKDHIVYQWNEGQLVRQLFVGDDLENQRPLPTGGGTIDVEFVHAGKQRVVRLRMHPLHQEKREPGNALEFTAALGGDWR